jgi:hypothetical protein
MNLVLIMGFSLGRPTFPLLGTDCAQQDQEGMTFALHVVEASADGLGVEAAEQGNGVGRW